MKLFVLYTAVGMLPKEKAEKFAKKYGKKARKALGKKANLLVIPIREGETRIEVLKG